MAVYYNALLQHRRLDAEQMRLLVLLKLKTLMKLLVKF